MLVYSRVYTRSSKFAGTHLYTWVKGWNDNVDGEHFLRFRDKNDGLKFIRLSVDVALVV